VVNGRHQCEERTDNLTWPKRLSSLVLEEIIRRILKVEQSYATTLVEHSGDSGHWVQGFKEHTSFHGYIRLFEETLWACEADITLNLNGGKYTEGTVTLVPGTKVDKPRVASITIKWGKKGPRMEIGKFKKIKPASK
jgi:hypothetical protein